MQRGGAVRVSCPQRATRFALATHLLGEINAELVNRPGPKTALERLRKRALESLARELATLNPVLGAEKVRLVFIGQVGVGKTTAICHLVGLTAVREKRKKVRAGVEKLMTVTEDLMATGSGFTTLCEVVVTPADGTKFEILPYDRAEVELTIDDFCRSIWSKVFPRTEDTAEGGAEAQVNFPNELVRAVRNMVRLPEGKEEDAAVRLAQQYGRADFEQFREAVTSRAALDARTETEFVIPAEHLDPRVWIKETFDGLNLARVPTASIPRRISLQVERGLLCPEMDRVAALIDTKGVDASQFNRSDLDAHIRGDPSAFCILVERFPSAPTNVIPLLQRHVTPEDPISGHKFALMVLPRGNEPDSVVGATGQVGEREPGILLRTSQIEETLRGRGLPEMGGRLIFFDPLLHYDDEKRMRTDSTQEDVEFERTTAWARISEALETRDNRIWDRVSVIGDILKRIKEGAGLDPREEELVRDAKLKIEGYRHLNLANADRFAERYRGLWEDGQRHTMVLRATNNRFGEYPARDIDIFYDAIPIAEGLVRVAGTRPKDAILEIIRGVRGAASNGSALHEVLSVLETQVNTSFNMMAQAVGGQMRDRLKGVAFAPRDLNNPFWVNVQARFGKGIGYRPDVLSMYTEVLLDEEGFLAEVASDCWRKILIEPILEYLG